MHLTDVGDWVETEALTPKEIKNLIDAAHIWAWRRKWEVTCLRYPANEERTMFHGRVTLIGKNRVRDYG